MRVIKDLFSFQSDIPCAVTIGKFDGIHKGHRELIRRAAAHARNDAEHVQSVVLTFDMAPAMLLTEEERRAVLEEMGADVLIECSFGPEIITLPAEAFISDVLTGRLRARFVIAGEDFRFGYERRGDDRLLRNMEKQFGYRTEIVPEVLEGGEPVSSTRIRNALELGNMEEVRNLLGYDYYVTGKIIHGRRLGRTIGVPTINQIPGRTKLLPPNGVYVSETVLEGRLLRGITNIGTKPTVGGHFVGAETYLFDFSGNVYDENAEVRLLNFLRPETRFGSLDELKNQIAKDEAAARRFER
ncbi:MAG: bifunctional riboflavin kinase/FAD synthetase [Lachnospiraceae bacterium]|nr:bifunctional riboflavin kinase/FAD synthetase [Lachnospiraceae bacterium]